MSRTSISRDEIKEMVRRVLDASAAGIALPAAAAPATEPEHVLVNSLKPRQDRSFERDESSKSLLTEDDIRGLNEGDRLRISPGTKFTPLASDLIRERRIELITKEPRTAKILVRSVALGADHGGFEYKEKIKEHLSGLGLSIRDFGTNSKEPVDYPDHAGAVAECVSRGRADAGIIVDGAGIGSAMTANKYPGVRAAACYSTALARNSREHNGANVLTLGSGQNSLAEVLSIVDTFLSSELTEDRHKRRVAKIEDIDRQYRR